MRTNLSKNEKDLVQACRKGDVATVEKLLNQGENADLVWSDEDETLLMTAVRHNNELIVDTLLLHGANINAKNNRGTTALIMACEQYEDNDAIINILLNNGADVNISDDDSNTALMWACVHGKLGAVNDLLSHNANVNMRDSRGETALLRAWGTCQDRDAIINMLLNNGVDVNISDDDGTTALMWACVRGKLGAVNDLLAHNPSLNMRNRWGETALMLACKKENIEIARELIESGASLNNIRVRNMQFITENLSECSTIKILTAILNRDSENLGSYLGEYFNKINKNTSPNEMSVLEYKRHITEFYKVDNYITNLKNSKEFKELREETKLLKEKIEKTNKDGSTLEELDEIKQKVHRNKMILKELKTFEMNTKDMLNIRTLRPIYCRKQSIDFEIK